MRPHPTTKDNMAHQILRNFVFLNGYTMNTLRKLIENVETVSVHHNEYVCQ